MARALTVLQIVLLVLMTYQPAHTQLTERALRSFRPKMMRLYGERVLHGQCIKTMPVMSDLSTLTRDHLHCISVYIRTVEWKSWDVLVGPRKCRTTCYRAEDSKTDFSMLMKNCEKCPQQSEYDAAISCYIRFHLSPSPALVFTEQADCTGPSIMDISFGIKLNKDRGAPPQPVIDANNSLSSSSASNGNVFETQLSVDDKHENASLNHFICVSYVILTSISEKPQEGGFANWLPTHVTWQVDDMLSKWWIV